MSSPGHLGKLIPELQIFSLPFLFPDNSEQLKSILTNGKTMQKFFKPMYSKKGLKLFTFYPEGWQVWTTNKPINSPTDLQGFKMRVMTSPLLLATFESYSATPIALPYSDVYSGLQLKMIDGQVNPIFAIEEMSFYEVSDYLIHPKATQFITSFITSQRFFQKLNPDYQSLVQKTAVEMQDYIFDLKAKVNADRLKKILQKKPGIKQIHLNDEQRKAFQTKAQKAYEVYLDIGGKQAASVLNSIKSEINRETK